MAKIHFLPHDNSRAILIFFHSKTTNRCQLHLFQSLTGDSSTPSCMTNLPLFTALGKSLGCVPGLTDSHPNHLLGFHIVFLLILFPDSSHRCWLNKRNTVTGLSWVLLSFTEKDEIQDQDGWGYYNCWHCFCCGALPCLSATLHCTEQKQGHIYHFTITLFKYTMVLSNHWCRPLNCMIIQQGRCMHWRKWSILSVCDSSWHLLSLQKSRQWGTGTYSTNPELKFKVRKVPAMETVFSHKRNSKGNIFLGSHCWHRLNSFS